MHTLKPLEYGQYYHIYNRGNNGENIFIEERNHLYFLDLYAKYIEPVADTFVYALLRNHFHLLVYVKTPEEQPEPDRPLNPTQPFSNLFNSYAKAVNKTYGRTGSLFQKRFGRILVASSSYLETLVRYIHLNPQKHGMVADFREYPYSSYQKILGERATRLKRDEVLGWFGGSDAFVAFHQSDSAGLGDLSDLVGNDD